MKNRILPGIAALILLSLVPISCDVAKKDTHSFIFDFNYEGSVNQTKQVKTGETATKINAPQRPSYNFLDWYSDRVGQDDPFDFSIPIVTDTTVYAIWSLKEVPSPVYSNDLPTLNLELFDGAGETINITSVDRANYVNGKVSLFDDDGSVMLNNVNTEFRGRGNGSWHEAPKKGYRFKFNSKQSLFGYTASKHWNIIPCTNFGDGTLARNAVAYNMARDVLSNIEYTTPTRWLNVYINGGYRGVYLLTEHVRVDAGRVDIDSKFGVLDTGYLIEYDGYATYDEATDTHLTNGTHYFTIPGVRYGFSVKSPDPDDYAGTPNETEFRKQVAFIQEYTAKTYAAALNKDYALFSTYADANSFLDMYVLHEYFKNTDTGWSSFYMYKKPGGKLFAGPAWDFDATAGVNRDDTSPTGIYVAGSMEGEFTSSELYISLYKTPEFKNAVKVRWNQISANTKAFVNLFLNDEWIEAKNTVMARNFAFWSSRSLAESEAYWKESVLNLRKWLIDRAEWLDKEWAI